MNNKSFKRSLFGVALSRFISLLSSISVGLLLPKILSVADYGYLKLFTLYAVYTALLHFGFVDGILLKLAGTDYSDLNFRHMRSYSKFFIALEIIISASVILCGVLIFDGEYRFVLITLMIDMVFVNITTYYQFISQATKRFAEFSQKNVIVSVMKLCFVVCLVAIYTVGDVNISYRFYIIGIVIIDFIMLLWYIYIYKNITFGNTESFRNIYIDICSIFKTGIVLTIAYQVSHLVLALDRQFVSVFFSTEEYAIYSFAYNIVSMISTMISSISVVLLPLLKKADKEYVINNYKTCISIVSILLAFSLIAFWPVARFIGWFLPEYAVSTRYIAIVLPSILFTSGISVVMFTIDKVMDTITAYFQNSLIALIMGFVTNTIAYLLFQSCFAISMASICTMATWYFIENRHLQEILSVKEIRSYRYIITIVIAFIVCVFLVRGFVISCVLYIATLVIVTIIFYKEDLKTYLRLLIKI